MIPIPGTTKVSRISENYKALNMDLTLEENKEVTELAEATEVKGDRFPAAFQSLTWA